MPFVHGKDFITFLSSLNIRVKEYINKSSVHIATPPFSKNLSGEKFGIALEHHRHFYKYSTLPNLNNTFTSVIFSTSSIPKYR